VRKAASRYYGEGRDLTTDEVRALAERFDPFQNLTAHYLLAGLLRST
jgi:3-methyladenine DNA glycosylase/8-oxoguanine DNA glycosylase